MTADEWRALRAQELRNLAVEVERGGCDVLVVGFRLAGVNATVMHGSATPGVEGDEVVKVSGALAEFCAFPHVTQGGVQ